MPASLSCDTSVALGSATIDGSTIFAKNSDRSANEAQPLIHLARAQHAPGATGRLPVHRHPAGRDDLGD